MFAKWALVVSPVSLLFAQPSIAAPNKVLFELQERCGQLAREKHQRDNGGRSNFHVDGGTGSIDFQNRYNARLNRCFYLETITILKPVGDSDGSSWSATLIDINENSTFGQFRWSDGMKVMILCYVGQSRCKSEAEWYKLIKPLMNE